jgi:DNA-binding FadR family transcriptional regulator
MVEWTGTPAYQQVADDLRRRIAGDDFPEGSLPSLATLQTEYKVSVTVVRAAINQLKADGLAYSHQGKGAYLTPDARTLARGRDAAGPDGTTLAGVLRELADLRRRVERLESARGDREGSDAVGG